MLHRKVKAQAKAVQTLKVRVHLQLQCQTHHLCKVMNQVKRSKAHQQQALQVRRANHQVHNHQLKLKNKI